MMECELGYQKKKRKEMQLEECDLCNDDWEDLEPLKKILEPFRAAQQELEGQAYVTISLVPYAVHVARKLLEETRRGIDAMNMEVLDLVDE